MSTENETPTPVKPGVVRRAAGTVVGHVKAKREFRLPTWVLYIVGVLGLIGVIYGGIQQARVWRWEKILKAAQLRIAELEADNKTVALKTTRKIAVSRIKVNKKKVKDIDKKIKVLDSQKKKIVKNTSRMSSVDLSNAFRGEGFKKSWEKK